MTAVYSDEFLSALGAWQAGWAEDRTVRLEKTARLTEAIKAISPLPASAVQPPPPCYRKRFLVPHNPQNKADFWPLFYDGRIDEGVASWTTNYDYSKLIFKTNLRPGTVACIFRREPMASEVKLNIAGLWGDTDFIAAAQAYISNRGENFRAIQHFRDIQSEVILDAPLTLDGVVAFCGQVPSLEQLCRTVGITQPEDEDALWQQLVSANLLPTLNYWLEGSGAQRALGNSKAQFEKILEK